MFSVVGFLIHSLLCPLGALLENTKRIEDYAIFTIPRVIEGLFDLFSKLGMIKPIKYSSEVIFAISIAIFLYLRNYYEDLIPSSYLKILNFIFDKKTQDRSESCKNFELDIKSTNEITFN